MIKKRQDIIKLPYIDKITVVQKRRAKYYNKKKYKPLTNKELPKKYSDGDYEFDTNGFLINKITKEKVIANPKTIGKEAYWVINFQPIYNGYLHPIQRAEYMKKIKNLMKDWVEGIKPFTQFPLRLELFIYAENMPVDVDNKGVVFFKCFTDLLTDCKIIPDDSSEYITDTGRTVWVKVPKHKEKMEFIITEI